MNRRWPSMLLLVVWCLLGTGTLAYVHNHQHACEDREQHGTPLQHDEGTCQVHAQLHMPVVAASAAMPAIHIEETARAMPVRESVHEQDARLDRACRDPPLTVL